MTVCRYAQPSRLRSLDKGELPEAERLLRQRAEDSDRIQNKKQ